MVIAAIGLAMRYRKSLPRVFLNSDDKYKQTFRHMRTILIVVCLLLALRGCEFLADNGFSTSGADIFNQALKEKDQDKRIELYTKAINKNPDLFEAYMNRGIEYLKKGANQKAKDDASIAIRLEPDDPRPYALRAAGHVNLKEFRQALSDSADAIQRKPDDAKYLIIRSSIYLVLKQYDDAIQDATKAIDLTPNETKAYYCRGMAYLYKENYDSAIYDFDKMIASHKYFTQPYELKALALLLKGDKKSAIATLKVAIKNSFYSSVIASDEDLKKFVKKTDYESLFNQVKSENKQPRTK